MGITMDILYDGGGVRVEEPGAEQLMDIAERRNTGLEWVVFDALRLIITANKAVKEGGRLLEENKGHVSEIVLPLHYYS